MLSARFLIPPTPVTPLISAPVPMARKRVPPSVLARSSGLGQPRPGQAPVARLMPFSCEFLGAAKVGERRTRKTLNSVVFIVPDRGSRRITLKGLDPTPPGRSLAKPLVPLNTLPARL